VVDEKKVEKKEKPVESSVNDLIISLEEENKQRYESLQVKFETY
jgi:hypothetical protein